MKLQTLLLTFFATVGGSSAAVSSRRLRRSASYKEVRDIMESAFGAENCVGSFDMPSVFVDCEVGRSTAQFEAREDRSGHRVPRRLQVCKSRSRCSRMTFSQSSSDLRKAQELIDELDLAPTPGPRDSLYQDLEDMVVRAYGRDRCTIREGDLDGKLVDCASSRTSVQLEASRVGFDLVPDTLDVYDGKNYSRLNLKHGSDSKIKQEVRNALRDLPL
jgi:hypothetical protein